MAVFIVSTYYTYQRRVGRADSAWFLVKYNDGMPARGHPSQY